MRAPQVLVSTLAARTGGVPAMLRFALDTLRSAGLEPVALPQVLVSLMELDGETAESLRNSQRERVSATVDLGTLTPDEEATLAALGRVVDLGKLAVVHFVDPEVRARNEKNE